MNSFTRINQGEQARQRAAAKRERIETRIIETIDRAAEVARRLEAARLERQTRAGGGAATRRMTASARRRAAKKSR